MRVVLWSPRAGRGWVAAVQPYLEREVRVDVVGEEPRSAPVADVDLYHVDDDPAHGFVYRTLLRRPGIVVLEQWGLHRLVHAETAGRAGDENESELAVRAAKFVERAAFPLDCSQS